MKSGNAPENRGSILLKPEENEQIFNLIGNRCQCLAAGVIQLYETEPPLHKEWIKKNSGIITLIRDTSKRSFFLRLYCVPRNSLIWEHEVYNSMEYKAPQNYFHTFEAEKCMTAFNFANETDAIVLRNILIEKLNTKRQRKLDRQASKELENQRSFATPNKTQNSTSTLGYNTNQSNESPLSIGLNNSMSSILHKSSKKKKKNQEAKKKLTTNDIGLPFDFRHVEHVGTDINNCRVIEPVYKAFFDKAGISDNLLENNETRTFIYDFIESHGGVNALKEEIVPTPEPQTCTSPPAKSEAKFDTPPPVPARTIPVSSNVSSSNQYQRKAPPLPPSQAQNQVPPAPPSVPPIHKPILVKPPPPPLSALVPNLPPPPPPPPINPVQTSKFVPNAPPPPPLPSTSNLQENVSRTTNSDKMVDDTRSKLMESIRSGTTLKKLNIEEIKSPTYKDTRSNLLDEIRQGIQLKPVTSEPRSTGITTNNEGGLAAALTRALAERSRAMYSQSEDSDSDYSDNDDEWDD